MEHTHPNRLSIALATPFPSASDFEIMHDDEKPEHRGFLLISEIPLGGQTSVAQLEVGAVSDNAYKCFTMPLFDNFIHAWIYSFPQEAVVFEFLNMV